MIHTFALKTLPSPETNDHQVRVIVDGEDWLGPSSLGLDPHEFFRQSTFTLKTNGSLIVGRCDCGVLGCCDTTVDVLLSDASVIWMDASGLNLTFDRKSYEAEIDRATTDTGWEDVKRTVERLAGDILVGHELNGFQFQWASARIKTQSLTLSYVMRDQQNLIELPWDGDSIQIAMETVRQFRESRTNNPMNPSDGSGVS